MSSKLICIFIKIEFGCIIISRVIKRRSKKVGLPPGTVVYVGEKKSGEVKIRIIDYDDAHFEEKEVKEVEECFLSGDVSLERRIQISYCG